MTSLRKKKTVNLYILPETDSKLDELCRVMFRFKGQVIDWLVATTYDELQKGGKIGNLPELSEKGDEALE